MTRSIKLFFLLVFLVIGNAQAQNSLYDCDHSKRFAGYLFNTGQFELSMHELERIAFFCDYDSTTQLTLLKTYRKLNKFDKANLYFESIGSANLPSLLPDFRDEYVRLLMTQKRYSEVKQNLANNLPIRERYEHLLGSELLLKNWEEAYRLSLEDLPKTNYKILGLKNVAAKSHSAKRKSPVLAALMSVLLPGSGKAYCGYWGDAAISFTFVASGAFFAIRGFQEYGTGNAYPWIIGGIALSYYAANIYGGASSAIRYNDNIDHAFIHETETILFSDY
ncbi:MAG TPA: hypothetical protein PLK12_08145 [Prolixibacteraceae bacterium]|nr:hypothetical protein [Prolixibacteraceae bacterium]